MRTIMTGMEWMSRWLARLGGVLILFAAALITLDVIWRSAFRSTAFESLELSSYAVAIATTFGLAWALVSKAHVRIEVIYGMLGRRLQAGLDVLALAVLALVAGVAAYWGGMVVAGNAQIGAVSNTTLAIPLIVPQGIWWLGIVWFAACALVSCLLALVGVCRGRIDEVRASFGPASVQDEVVDSTRGVSPRSAIAETEGSC